jgi:signal transduction histidine kinase
MQRVLRLVRLLSPPRGDALIAAAAAALAQVEIWTLADPDAPRPVLALAGLAMTLPIAWRRRAPLAVLVAVTSTMFAATAAWDVVQHAVFPGPPLLIALYSAGRHLAGRRVVLAAAVAAASVVRIGLEDMDEVSGVGDVVGNFLFGTIVIGVPFVAGRAVRVRQLHASAAETRAVAAETRSEQRARQAAAEERARIARELHDVVGHSLSVIVVQAGVERKLLGDREGSTRETLETVERTAREALGEMRRLLGMLRRDDEELALAPQPSLGQIDHLLAQVRTAGLPVELEVQGPPVELPPGVDLSAYRIVQEALTNALKHAGPAKARVRITYEPEAVLLEIEDDGRAAEGSANGGGHGLIGMRERVSLYGGSLRAGKRDDGGYAVRARLPVAPSR